MTEPAVQILGRWEGILAPGQGRPDSRVALEGLWKTETLHCLAIIAFAVS